MDTAYSIQQAAGSTFKGRGHATSNLLSSRGNRQPSPPSFSREAPNSSTDVRDGIVRIVVFAYKKHLLYLEQFKKQEQRKVPMPIVNNGGS
jgi:hypothetical protein